MQQYLDLAQRVLAEGHRREDRTGVGTISLFGHQMRFNLQQGFPLLTTKKLHWKSIAYELLWFLQGDTNIGYLKEHGVSIWDEWADAQGNLGPIYGSQWRSWPDGKGGAIDQLANVLNEIARHPESRRLVVSAWNVAQLPDMALSPCHVLFQFYVDEGHLSCQLYQRSADVFLGLPFNIASYALLTHLVAHSLGLKVGDLVHTLGDVHIYLNHIEAIKLQLTRTPRPLPQLVITSGRKSLFDYTYGDFYIEGYNPHPHIHGRVAV